jgi:hypothetical protein
VTTQHCTAPVGGGIAVTTAAFALLQALHAYQEYAMQTSLPVPAVQH